MYDELPDDMFKNAPKFGYNYFGTLKLTSAPNFTMPDGFVNKEIYYSHQSNDLAF